MQYENDSKYNLTRIVNWLYQEQNYVIYWYRQLIEKQTIYFYLFDNRLLRKVFIQVCENPPKDIIITQSLISW